MMAGYIYQGTHEGPDIFDAVALKPPRERGVRRPRELRPCGTPAAYKRHKYINEEPCEPCTTAYLIDRRERDARRQAAS